MHFFKIRVKKMCIEAVVLPASSSLASRSVHSFIVKNRREKSTLMLTNEYGNNSVAKGLSLLIIAAKANSKSLEQDLNIEN